MARHERAATQLTGRGVTPGRSRTLLLALALALVGTARAQEAEGEPIGEMTFYADLAVDADGRPHVAFSPFGYPADLQYAVRRAGGWRTETIADGGSRLALALDPDGAPHVAYVKDGVQYAVRGRRGWDVRAVGDRAELDHPAWVDLAIDGRGRPTIAVNTGWIVSGARLRRERFLEDGDEVDFNSNHADGSALALDAEGRPHLAYERRFDTEYARPGGGAGWEHWPVDDLVGVPSLTIGPDGAPRLLGTRRDPEGKDAVFAVLEGGEWRVERVGRIENDASVPAVPTMALGPSGDPHVVFHSGRSLRHATRTPEGWVDRPLVTPAEGELGVWAQLAVDLEGRPHVIYGVTVGRGTGVRTTLHYAVGRAGPAVGSAGPGRTAGADPAPAEPAGDRSAGGSAAADPAGGGRPGADGGATAGPSPAPAGGAAPAARPPGPEPSTGPEAEEVAAEVRERVEDWFSRRDADDLTCPECEGSAVRPCRACDGAERLRCPTCRGAGRVPVRGRAGRELCRDCTGDGELDCPRCAESDGEEACRRCADTPGYRRLQGTRAFWRFISPSARDGRDRGQFVADVLAGLILAEAVGAAPGLHSARIERVDVFRDEVRVVARVQWSDGRSDTLTTTWVREDGQFYLVTGREERDVLIDEDDDSGEPEEPTPRRGRGARLLAMAKNYVDNGAYRVAVRKLEEALEQSLTDAQRAEAMSLLAFCRAELERR